MLPDVEVSNEQIFNFGSGGVKLNPLIPGLAFKIWDFFTET
jgi:hypothetical protein